MPATIPSRELARMAFRRQSGWKLPVLPDAGDLRLLSRSFARNLEDRELSPATVRTYLQGLNSFGKFLVAQRMPTTLANVTGEHVREFLRSLAEAGQSDNTRANRYRALVSFFNWLVDEDEIRKQDNPMLKIKQPKISQTLPRILEDAEISALLDTCRGADFLQRRDYAIIRLFFDIGVRRSGLAYLRVQDVDIASNPPTVTIVGKGHNGTRHVYSPAIGRKTAAALDRYLRMRQHHPHRHLEALWIGRQGALNDGSIDLLLKRRAKEAGIEDMHAHLFRHKFAHDQLSEPDVKEGDVLEQGGWRDPAMLRRYGRSAAAERARIAHARKDLSSRL